LQKGLTDLMISRRRIGWLVRRVARKSGFVPRSPAPPGGSCTSLPGSFAGIVARAVPDHFMGDTRQNAVGTLPDARPDARDVKPASAIAVQQNAQREMHGEAAVARMSAALVT